MLHLAARERAESFEGGTPYTPEGFADEGFIHCTDGAANVVAVGNRYYNDDEREFVVFVIDREQLSSPVTYEDPERIYPHIYGPLNADAIVAMLPAPRRSDGTFLPLELPVELAGRV